MFTYEFRPERLKVHRKALKLSLRGLADKAGINHTTLSRAERGEREPNASQVGVLAGVFGVTPNHFYEKVSKP